MSCCAEDVLTHPMIFHLVAQAWGSAKLLSLLNAPLHAVFAEVRIRFPVRRPVLYVMGEQFHSLSNKSAGVRLHERSHWESLPPLQFARTGWKAVDLCGDVYALGGIGDPGGAIASVERYCRDGPQRWEELPPMHHARRAFAVTGFEGSVYALGGFGADNAVLQSVERFNPCQGFWEQLSDMPFPRRAFSVLPCRSCLYAISGRNQGVIHSPVVYDISSNRWDGIPRMHQEGRDSFGQLSARGGIYVAGGLDASRSVTRTSERFDPSDAGGRWQLLPCMLQARSSLAVAELAGSIYAIGGRAGNEWVHDVERLDLRMPEWHQVAPVNGDVRGSAVTLADSIYFVTRHHCERYDARMDCWQGIPQDIDRAVAAVLSVSLPE